jgi:hypothetical protein
VSWQAGRARRFGTVDELMQMAIDDDGGSKTEGMFLRKVKNQGVVVRQFGEVAVDESCFPFRSGGQGSGNLAKAECG